MALQAPPPERRVRGKSSRGTVAQTPLPEPVELGDEATSESKRMVYLVTLPHPRLNRSSDGFPLTAPGSLTKPQVLQRFQDACTHPVYIDPHSLAGNHSVSLSRVGIWREFHKPDDAQQAEVHDHLAVLATSDSKFRFAPVKRALLRRHGLASHWSCTHTGYWSCVRYCAVPSPKKPSACLDKRPLLWAVNCEHPAVEDCTHEPVTANALRAKRLKQQHDAAEHGKEYPRVTEMDVWALVVRIGVKNTDDNRNAHLELANYAKKHCSVTMCAYLFKNRAKLPTLIDDIWQWECVEELASTARQTRLEALDTASQAPCVCGGQWSSFVTSSFAQNGLDIRELCHDVYLALGHGRQETTPVVVLAGSRSGEGKSVFLKPLHSVFASPRAVFASPNRGNFPFAGFAFCEGSLLG